MIQEEEWFQSLTLTPHILTRSLHSWTCLESDKYKHPWTKNKSEKGKKSIWCPCLVSLVSVCLVSSQGLWPIWIPDRSLIFSMVAHLVKQNCQDFNLWWKKLFTFFLSGVYPVSQTFIFHGGQNIEQLQEKLEAIHPSTLAMFLRQHWSRATLMMLPPRIGRRWRDVVAAGISALRSSSLFDINKCKLNHTM